MIGLCHTVGKTARGMLNQLLVVWAAINAIEKRYGLPPTPIYAITSLTADTTTFMSGEFRGFQALFEMAREEAGIRDGRPGTYKLSTYKQCNDHVCNLVRATFDREVVNFFLLNGMPHLVCTKKTGSKLSMHYHVIRRIAKQVLTNQRSEYSRLKHEQDKREGTTEQSFELQKTAFNRFCTFGVSAQCIEHYVEIFRVIVPDLVDLLDDPFVAFLLDLECAYSQKFELPFLKGSHDLGVCASEDYEYWYNGHLAFVRTFCRGAPNEPPI